MRLEEKYINYVRDAVDQTVGDTNYPCLGSILETSGIASRRQLRILEKRGHLQSVTIQRNNGETGRGTQYKAYYTERVEPEWVTLQTRKQTVSIEGATEE